MRYDAHFKNVAAFVLIIILPFAASAESKKGRLELNSPEAKSLLEKIPAVAHEGTWPLKNGFVRYDSLERKGHLLEGNYAANLAEACSKKNGRTTMPDEKSWKEPVETANCADDGELVLHIELK
jgi:hypothetical protein